MNSIRRRLAFALCTGLGLLLLVGMGALYGGLRHALLRQFDETLVAIAHDLEADIQRGERPSISPGPHFEHEGGHAPQYRFLVTTRDDKVLFSDGLTDPSLFAALNGQRGPPRFGFITLPRGQPGRAVALASRGPESIGPLHLIVTAESRGLEHVLGHVLLGTALVGATLLGATINIVFWTLRRELRPLDTLAGEAARIDATSLDRRFGADRLPAELQPIATRLNDLLARLEGSFARERRVNADLAHELRTPLAELRVLAESALKWPDARDPHADRDVLAIAQHMEALIGRMLLIARSEEGRLEQVQAAVDVTAMLGEVWRHFAARATTRGLVPRIELAPATASADPVLLRSVLTNLVENAVDYAPAGGAITITCGPLAEGGVAVTVANTAPNLQPDDVPRLFERFWRKDAARSTSGHFGLGLALTQRFCEAMGWRISAELSDGATLAITVHGPRCR